MKKLNSKEKSKNIKIVTILFSFLLFPFANSFAQNKALRETKLTLLNPLSTISFTPYNQPKIDTLHYIYYPRIICFSGPLEKKEEPWKKNISKNIISILRYF